MNSEGSYSPISEIFPDYLLVPLITTVARPLQYQFKGRILATLVDYINNSLPINSNYVVQKDLEKDNIEDSTITDIFVRAN